jgi:hypothetical protein
MVLTMVLIATAATGLGCRPAVPAGQEGESAALRQAKALIDKNALVFEAAVAAASGVDTQPDRARELGDQLRKGLEANKAEAEALEKKLTEDDRVKLREYGRTRLAPAVVALEKKLLGPAAQAAPKPEASPASDSPALPAAQAASPAGG